jgi:hypothetical protein
MNEFTIKMDKYTDAELDAMCLNSENQQLKKRIATLEEENQRLINDLLQLSQQMEGMIYEN